MKFACLLGGVGVHGWVVRFWQPLVQSASWSWVPIVMSHSPNRARQSFTDAV